MSAVQPNQLSSFSPVLLSPTSTTLTNHISHFDNSDQGSVDSDYTSLGSSKFYGNSGSSSSLHRQGRSHSIDELASTPGTTTTIPTRHFNGNVNGHKSNADPLQFVKVHPNHDLIERAQEQLSLAESRKRLQDNYKLTPRPSEPKANDDEVDWSKAVENWRQKRELKRLKSANGDNERPLSPIRVESPPKAQEARKQRVNEPASKPPRAASSPPIEKHKSKSPSPVRVKGPAKVREVSLDKPVEMRGFGFKLDGGRAHNRPIFISTIEEGSPADKAGLGIDDEILAINNESVENTTFDQVRRILKERNIRGSIKLLVRTYEDLIDDNSQTVSTGFATDHSRTPSPQKPAPPATKPSSTPSPTSNNLSPVYTFLPYNPPAPEPLTSSTSLNILAPKPFRSTASISLDVPNQQEPAVATTTTSASEKQPTYPTQFPPPRILMDTSQIAMERPPPLEPISSVNIFVQSVAKADTNGQSGQQRNDSPITQVRSYVEKQMDQLQQDLEFGFSRTPKVPPPPPPTLLSTTPIGNLTNTLAPEQQQRPVSIPIDLSHAKLPPPPPPPSEQHELQRSSLKKSLSTQNELDQVSHNRTYGLKVNPKEQMIQYLDPYSPPKPAINYVKRSIPDLPSTAHSIERTVNELRIDLPSSYSSQPHVINQQQKKVTIQLGDQSHPQRISSKHLHTTLNQAPRKTQVEDNSWIHHDHRNGVSNGRRSAPNTPHQPEAPIVRPPPPAEYDYHPRNGYQRNVDLSPSKQQRTKPVGRTMSNDRVLSVSGKLRCSRCQDELGHGSAMVIESLGLYYHIECFCCFVCNAPLSSSPGGIDVRVRSNRLHCQNCFSDENGVKLSAV